MASPMSSFEMDSSPGFAVVVTVKSTADDFPEDAVLVAFVDTE